MRTLRPNDLRDLDRTRLETLSQDELLETCVRLRALAIEQADRLNRHSGNSSKPPSSNDPYRRGAKTPSDGSRAEDGKGNGDDADGPSGPSSPQSAPSSRPPGRQKGAPGTWRGTPLVAEGTVDHRPDRCAIGSREKTELLDLIGESFLGWLVTDGYGADRSHRQRQRQRCLAHLIRKAVALQEGIHYDAARFGDGLCKDLRALIRGVAEDADARTLNPIIARLITRLIAVARRLIPAGGMCPVIFAAS